MLRKRFSDKEVETLLDTGRLRRLRHGWFAESGADSAAVRAVVAGGSLTCVSALENFWTPRMVHLHVRVPANSCRRVRAHSGIREHRAPRDVGQPAVKDPVALSLAMALGCVSEHQWIAMVDSVLHTTRWDPHGLQADIAAVAPAWHATVPRLMGMVDARSESGSESLLRCALVARGYDVKVQVQIGRDRVDLLVGDRLVIECDSVAFHWSPDGLARDRQRDQRLHAQGFLPVRFTYKQIVYELDDVLAQIARLTRNGHHRWAVRDRRLSA